jgi:hypothetical protein
MSNSSNQCSVTPRLVHFRVTYWRGKDYKGVVGVINPDTWDEANKIACRYNLLYCYQPGHFEVRAFNLKAYMECNPPAQQ